MADGIRFRFRKYATKILTEHTVPDAGFFLSHINVSHDESSQKGFNTDRILINGLLTVSLGISTAVLCAERTVFAVVYVALLVMSAVLVGYTFCARCPSCQKRCAHPQIGIVRKLLPQRSVIPYGIIDYLGVVPFIVIAIVIPQYWLWQNKVVFGVFWVLITVTGIGILSRLCPKCENSYCVMNRNPKLSRNT